MARAPKPASMVTIWLGFLLAASVIVGAGTRLARYGDVLGEKTGLGRTWVGVVVLAATTSLPELVTGFGSTALSPLPDIAVGDVLGSCMFNLLILSMMDALQPEPLCARAHQGHALSIAFGLLLVGLAILGIVAGDAVPRLAWFGGTSVLLIALYAVAMRTVFSHERTRLARERQEVAEELQYVDVGLGTAVGHYAAAAAAVTVAALWLPSLGAQLADQTGLGQAFVGSLFIALTTSLPEVVVSIAAVRIGAVDLGIGNVLGSNLFNMAILGFDDVFYRGGVLLASIGHAHLASASAVVMMYALFLIGLTYRVMTKRFVVTWDTGAMAVVYAAAVAVSFLLRS